MNAEMAARLREVGKTGDWVVIHPEEERGPRPDRVVTETRDRWRSGEW